MEAAATDGRVAMTMVYTCIRTLPGKVPSSKEEEEDTFVPLNALEAVARARMEGAPPSGQKLAGH